MTKHWTQSSKKLTIQPLLSIFSLLPIISFAQNLIDDAEMLFNSSFKIQAIRDTTINNRRFKVNSIGTGFILRYNIGKDTVGFLITNSHVIRKCKYGILKFNSSLNHNPNYGNVITIKFRDFDNLWVKHPTEDLAALPIYPLSNFIETKLKKGIFARTFDEIHLLPSSKERTLSALQDILMLGYPKGFSDTINNLPILRKGTTATPIFIDYNNQKRFLLDIPVYSGSSGSPVILFPATYSKNYDTTKNNVILAGVTVESQTYEAKGRTVSRDISKSVETTTSLPFEIAVVIKSSVLIEWKQMLIKEVRDKRFLNPKDFVEDVYITNNYSQH